MATRAIIEFYTKFSNPEDKDKDDFRLSARIYKHWDGYPDGVVPMFEELAKLVDKEVEDKENAGLGHQANDGANLGAYFIRVFKNRFGDLYISPELHGDIEYLYKLKSVYNGDSKRDWTLEVYEVDFDYDKDTFKDFKLIRTIKL